jgi:hypothetical protein
MKSDQVLCQYSIRQQEIYYCDFKVWIFNKIQRDEYLIRNACDYQPEAAGYSLATTRLQIPESGDLYRRRTDNLH